MEGLKVSDANLLVYVHPSKANAIHHAILHQLNTFLFTFNENFDGVLLTYSFEILSKNAKILRGLIPYLSVNIKAKLLLFYPKEGMLLDGKVAKLSKDSLHIIVLGICSVAVVVEDIRNEFEYIVKDGMGAFVSTTHKRHVIKLGTMVRVLVKSFDEEILHISGSLIPDNTGSTRWLSRHGQEDLHTKRRSKRERTIHGEHGSQIIDPSTPLKARKTVSIE